MLVAREPIFPFLGLRRYMSSINDYISFGREIRASVFPDKYKYCKSALGRVPWGPC